jgi:hypothetical protein
MFAKTTRHPAYTDDDPRIVLALRAATEPPPRRWKVFARGCVAEFVLLSLVVLGDTDFGPRTEEPPKPRTPTHTTLLYIPPVAPPASQAPPPPPPNAAAVRTLPAVPVDPGLASAKVKVEMSAIVISVEDDVGNQLPAVLKQQNGTLALLEAKDPTFAHYTFTPPDWRMEERVVDVSRKVRFTMLQPSRWPMVQSLIAGSGITMERYQLCALFDRGFYRCIEQEIRNHAGASAEGRVHTVKLAFNSSRSCGIDVLNVEFYPAP